MATQFFILLVAVQSIFVQGRGYRALPPANAWGSPAALSASKGPGVSVSSASSIPPRGVSLSSENAIEGNLAVTGRLPFLGSVGLDGVVPSHGTGVVDYNTGNAIIGIKKEEIKVSGYGSLSSPCVGAAKTTKTILSDGPIGITITASSGDLVVSSGSSLTPNGVFVISENTYEGPVSVAGTLPFLGVVSFNDVLPTVGSGTVAYKCGDEPITINEICNPLKPSIIANSYSDITCGKNFSICQKSARNIKY